MKFLAIALLLPLFSFSQSFTEKEISRYKVEAKNVIVIRDIWGIPHIYGKKDADAVFGLMYVQCEENFKQVEENNLEMLGRLSEVYGKEQLYNDLQMRLIYDSSAAIHDYKKSPPWLKKLLDAFADGVNYFLYSHPDVKPAVLKHFEPWYALMRTDGSISATQTGGLKIADIKELYKIADGSTSFNEKKIPFNELEPSSSNGFAVAPWKTKSKNAILYINPHVTFYFRDEVQIVSDEGLNAYGAVTWGTFFVYQGFNEHCGWMHTTSYADVADLFDEKIEKRNDSIFYRYDGKWYPVKTKKEIINYKRNDNLMQQPFTVYSTLHGPVMGSRNEKWLSLKENNRSLTALMQSWLRIKAKGFNEFKKVMELRSNNSNNTVFADDKGNIAYWHGNFIPQRNKKFDYSLPVDGSTSATNWKGIHPLDEIVHVYNPKTGWIENCNSTPFTCSGESSPKKENFPAYMAPDGQNPRAVNAVRLLNNAHDLTIDKMIHEIGFSHYLSAFEILLPLLIKAYDELPEDNSLKKDLREPIEMLRSWDKNSSSSSVVSTIAIEWAYRMAQKASPPANPYRESDAIGQLNSMVANTSPHEKLELLKATFNDLEKRFGKWKIAWAEINRYQRTTDNKFDDKKPSFPVGLASATWGSIPSFATRRLANTDKRYGVSGNSFIACVEFGKKVKAKTVVTGGESFDPNSKHYADQTQRYIDGNFKDIFFYKEDVMKHAEKIYHPGE
jgi:acyl-homoserine lactone acylase PvdQ